MPNNTVFQVDNNIVTILRPDRDEIMFTTYREDYWDELTAQTWRLDNKGYPTCSRLKHLHRYIMGKWYGEDVLKDLTKKGFVVEHLDNAHHNCRIDNLEFLLNDFNRAKGQWLDKQIREKQLHYAMAIYKDFKTGCYQITIGMNSPVCRIDSEGKERYVSKIYFLYDEDYPIVITDAQMMLLQLERNAFNPSKYNACSYHVEDYPDIELTEEEKEGFFVERDGEMYLIIGNGKAWINKISPIKNWTPPDRNM